MRFLSLVIAAAAILFSLAFLHAQRPFREYPAFEYDQFPLPDDFGERTEWVFARLMYPPVQGFQPRGWTWEQGRSYWTMDYPRSDRHFVQALRRLTRVHTRSVEQCVNPDDDDEIFNWPWIYGVEVGHWDLTEEQTRKLREYLLRGGFLMVDDFHGSREWDMFLASMNRVFPDRQVVDIKKDDAPLHVLYDLSELYQVPGAHTYLESGRTYEQDGIEPHFRGIYDDRGRLMVAICHNMDLGDSWEWADAPQYPEKFSSLGIRLGVNYVIYSMTH